MFGIESAAAQGPAAAGDPTTALIMNLAPLFVISLIWAIPVFRMARKQHWNPWIWTILILVPFIGSITLVVFFVCTWMTTLDRLNKLEGRQT